MLLVLAITLGRHRPSTFVCQVFRTAKDTDSASTELHASIVPCLSSVRKLISVRFFNQFYKRYLFKEREKESLVDFIFRSSSSTEMSNSEFEEGHWIFPLSETLNNFQSFGLEICLFAWHYERDSNHYAH